MAHDAFSTTVGGAVRTHDADATKRDIIEVATKEFARNGLSGSRIDEIAAKTKTSKRMIYYYFGDKEGLYLASSKPPTSAFAPSRLSSTWNTYRRSMR